MCKTRHELNVERWNAVKKEIESAPVKDYKISNSLCKTHDMFFVDIDGYNHTTCNCRVSNSWLRPNHDKLGKALLNAASNINKLKKELLLAKEEIEQLKEKAQ